MENRKQITDLYYITRVLDEEALYKLDCKSYLEFVREFNVYLDKRDEFDGIVWISAIDAPTYFRGWEASANRWKSEAALEVERLME